MDNGTSREDFVRIEFDRPRILRFDTNAVCDFDDAYGKSVLEVVYGAPVIPLGALRALLWAGLKHEDRKLSREKVGAFLEDYLVAGKSIQELADAVTEAVDRSRLFVALKGAVDPNPKGGVTSSPSIDSGSPKDEPSSTAATD